MEFVYRSNCYLFYSSSCTVAKFLVPDRRDKVDSGIGLSYRPPRLHKLAGRYLNPMPESITSLCQSLRIWPLDLSSERALGLYCLQSRFMGQQKRGGSTERILKQKAIPNTVSNPFVERFYGFRQYFLTVLCVTLINELFYRNVIRLRYMYNCKSPLESLLLYVPNFLKF